MALAHPHVLGKARAGSIFVVRQDFLARMDCPLFISIRLILLPSSQSLLLAIRLQVSYPGMGVR